MTGVCHSSQETWTRTIWSAWFRGVGCKNVAKPDNCLGFSTVSPEREETTVFLRQLLPDPLQRKCTRCIRPRRYRDAGCRTGGGDRKVVSRFERTPKAAEVPHTDRQSVMAPNMLGVERAPFFTLFQSHLSQFVAEPFPQRHTSHVGESGAGFRFDQQACIGTYRLV